MRPNKQFSRWRLSTMMMLLLATSVLAQSASREAVKWFNIGLKERNDYNAIEAYKKAIDLDGSFIEALINLGMRCKAVGDLTQAESHLQRALVANSEKITADLKFKIQFEIANIYLRKENAPAYEAKIEEARRSTANPALLATLSFEHGRYLYQKQRYREAVSELRNGLRANPANRQYFENLIALAEKALRMETLYTRAVAEENAGNTENALAIFQEIVALDPNFRDVQEKMANLEARADSERKATNLTTQYAKAAEFVRNDDFEAAIAAYENLLKQAPNEQQAQQQLEATNNMLLARRQQQALDQKYAEAEQALQSDNLTRAIVLFEEIVSQNPDFRDAANRLEIANTRIENKTAEAVVQRYYLDGLTDLQAGAHHSALSAFQKAYAIEPAYKDVSEKIADIEAILDEVEKGATEPAFSSAQRDSLLSVAEALIAKQQWQDAEAVLAQLTEIAPRNDQMIEVLAEMRARIDAGQAQRATAGKNTVARIIFVAGGAIAMLIVLPLAGAFVFAPTVRMRYYLMTGNLTRAATLVEKLLEKNPGRLKLYPVLANIYLLKKRNDERAIKVYRTVAQLNLATQNKRAIEAMLANYYMVESGEADEEAIKILEDRLRDELRQRKAK